MSEREHRATVRTALRVDDELRGMFARLGSAEHPNGRVLRTYRVARRALQATLQRQANGLQAGAVAETLDELKRSMRQIGSETLSAAAQVGVKSARAQLDVYRLIGRPAVYSWTPALTAWMATVESQASAVQAAVATGAEPELIVGDATQPGMLSPSGPTREGAKWAAIVATSAWWAWIEASNARRDGPDALDKQAVAAIDERTTECCLRVHGQIVPLDDDFTLTGRPRFGDRLQWTPFHWYCRSAVALVRRADRGDGLTQELTEAALRELRARSDGSRAEIHPAHGRSRR